MSIGSTYSYFYLNLELSKPQNLVFIVDSLFSIRAYLSQFLNLIHSSLRVPSSSFFPISTTQSCNSTQSTSKIFRLEWPLRDYLVQLTNSFLKRTETQIAQESELWSRVSNSKSCLLFLQLHFSKLVSKAEF